MIRRGARRAAVAGAFLAGAVILAFAALRGGFDVWLAGAAGLAVLLAVISPWRGDEPGPAATSSGEDRLAPADALLASIPDPAILVDGRAVVIEANEAARGLLPSLRLRHPLSFALRAPDVLDGVSEALRSGRALKVEYSERVPTERAFEVQIAPIGGEPGRQDVALFFRDLTSARRLEHVRVDFIANVSHELRTPLASLLGFIETLQGPARNDAAARERFLDIMRQQAARMARLVDDLLSLSRIELRAHLPPENRVDLSALAESMVEALRPMAAERRVALSLTANDTPLVVLGDRDELSRVLDNLIENAVKYGESGERVEIALTRAGDEVVLSVRDFGPGIAPEHLPRLTERFYRVDVAESRSRGGTGLGLAIVKHIVARHRGKLTIESEPGQGASVTVTIPIAGAPVLDG